MDNNITSEKVLQELEQLPPREYQSTSQRKLFSEVSSALLKGHLEDLIEERNWVTGIIMSASILEFAGKTRLVWKQKSTTKPETHKKYELNFAATIQELFENKIIDEATRDRMIRIKNARNAAAHDLPHQVALSREKKPNDVLEGHIRAAIKIMEDLFLSTG